MILSWRNNRQISTISAKITKSDSCRSRKFFIEQLDIAYQLHEYYQKIDFCLFSLIGFIVSSGFVSRYLLNNWSWLILLILFMLVCAGIICSFVCLDEIENINQCQSNIDICCQLSPDK